MGGARREGRRVTSGLVALGDSITYGHGGMQSGLGSQSWAQWLAEAMELPFTRLAVNGATAPDVVREQLPRLRGRGGATRSAAVYVGVNDVRDVGWDAAAYERDLDGDRRRGRRARCDRMLAPDAARSTSGCRRRARRCSRPTRPSSASPPRTARPSSTCATSPARLRSGPTGCTRRPPARWRSPTAPPRALGAPLPVADRRRRRRARRLVPWHYAKRSVRERLRVAVERVRA